MGSRKFKNLEDAIPASSRLNANKQRILDLWEHRVCKTIPAAKAQSERQLRNSLPQFLDRLSHALSPERLRPISFEELNDISEDHGEQRSTLKEYSLHQVIREFQILRETILGVLEEDGPISSAERDIILSAVEQGMAESGAQYMRQAQAKHRAIEARHRLILEGVKDHAIMRIDRDGKILDWNKGAENIFQYAADEIVGRDIRILFTPEDQTHQASVQEMNTALKAGKAEDKRWHLKKDGSRFFANGVMNSIKDESGKVIGFVKVLRDETDRISAEEKLENSRALLEEVIRHVPIGISITDAATGKALFHNEEADRLTERPVSKRKSLEDFVHYGAIHADGRPYEVDDYPTARALKKGEVVRDEEMLYRRKDGVATLLVSSSPIRDSKGSIRAAVTAVHDLTERKKAEAQIEMARRQLHEVFMQARTPMVIISGTDHRFLLANPLYEKLVGRKVVGKTFEEVFTEKEALETVVIIDRVFQTGEPYILTEAEFPLLDEHGVLCTHILNVSYTALRDGQGKINAVTALVIDVTDQVRARQNIQESEARFRQIANALPLIVWTADADFFVDWYNDWWFNYLGLPRGTPWDDPDTKPMHPEDVERTRPRLREAVETGKDFFMEQRFRRGSDGQYRWHLVRGVPIRDATGKIIKWIGANTDIHDQKILLRQLEEERELRERFVATLSHDLRTPLTAARMSAQMLNRRGSDLNFLHKAAPRIVENIDRADQMIRDLLDANRIKAGEKLPMDMAECEVRGLTDSTLEEIASIHGDRFVLEAPEPIKGFFSCSGIRRILENLCANAIKYGANDKPVTVSIQKTDHEVELKVHNHGAPISPEDLKTLFDPFRRTASAQSGGQKGWGLGLTLVKGIAEAHGGRVDVESEQSKGTTFFVWLPLDVRTNL